MMNSPCAMLMTPICPKVSDRPSAMSSSTAPMLMPVKSWLTTKVTIKFLPVYGWQAAARHPQR
jgi:hypothetical protein